MNLQKVKNIIEELKELGFKGSYFRIIYELQNRLGLKKALEPVKLNHTGKWLENISTEHFPTVGFKVRANLIPFFLNTLPSYLSYLNKIPGFNSNDVIEKAEKSAQGSILTFSKIRRNYGNPKQWNYNPIGDRQWPNVHYSQVMKYEPECGDIKLVWELNRFGFVYDYVRAYYLTEDSHWCRVFCDDIRNWQENNPYRLGPNWNSGQELAIRVLAWLFGLYAFSRNTYFTEEDFEIIVSLMFLHGEHLETNINYARKAVHNNHLIGEALGLYAIGLYFPWFKQSKRWKSLGRYLLENDCLRQFYDDGGYCQNSHNYHRLALYYYLWAYRIAELNGEPLDNKVTEVMEKSLHFLLAQINEPNGMLPNYGANDGALLTPWTSCDYTDYRPLLNSLNYLIYRERLFKPGPWDEELLWFFGPEALESPIKEPVVKSESFPVAGLHVLRQSPEDFVVFRCGSVIDRFGQADQLHVDIWWKGINIAQDAGSYLYNDELEFHHHFVGTSSHNTVTVDDENQMLLCRRFKFLYWTKAKLLDFNIHKEIQEVMGEHYGFFRLKEPFIHRRKVVSVNRDISVIVDKVFGKEKLQFAHKIRLHWLLAKFNYDQFKMKNWHVIKLATPNESFCVLLMVLNDEDNQVIQPEVESIVGMKNCPRGWISRYYSYKEEAISLSVSVENTDTKFITLFMPERYVKSIKLNWMQLMVGDTQINLAI